ncbi:MAG: hypothetical protein V2B18_24560, partial [Pseudomonadota bacterium]
NRLYVFREATADERLVEAAVGEKLFMPPNPKQAELLKGWLDPTKKVFTFTGSNRSGKSVFGTIMALSVVFGRTLWDDRKIEFMHRRPRRVRYVGQGWESHIKAVVVPLLKYWWPKNRRLETKKNNQGVDAIWKDLASGSTLEIMSTSQSSDVFEGWDGDLVVYDEPPPRDIRVACARGLIDRQGRELFGATLLKEAWIHREVIKARLPDGKPDLSVCNVVSTIWDNVGYGLTKEGIDQFERTLKPDEKQARLFGKPSYMSSLVFPRFDRDKHLKSRFKIPLDWINDFSIDFHPSKPWAIGSVATAKSGFKYFSKEFQLRGGPKFVGEEIIRYVKDGNLRVGKATIDPLAKGDENAHEDAATVFDTLSQTLAAHGISLDVASKDKSNGIQRVNDLLWTENEMPGLFFFDDCVNTIRQVEDLMYDPESLKDVALKVDDDFTECLYRLALLDTQWFPEIQYDMKQQRNVML